MKTKATFSQRPVTFVPGEMMGYRPIHILFQNTPSRASSITSPAREDRSEATCLPVSNAASLLYHGHRVHNNRQGLIPYKSRCASGPAFLPSKMFFCPV